MAKKSTRKVSRSSSRDYKDIFQKLTSNPAVRYVAGGLATAALTKVAVGFSKRYPEISNILKENFDYIEDKLVEFREGVNQESRSQDDSTSVSH